MPSRGIDRGTDAGRDRHLAAVEPDRRRHRLQQLAGDQRGVVRPRQVLHQHRELVAAEPGHGVGGAHPAAQPLAHGAEQGVPGEVAHLVADRLEAIEVDDHHRQHGPVAASRRQPLLQPVGEEGAVGKAGQLVALHEAAQPLDPLLARHGEADRPVEPLGVELLLVQHVDSTRLDHLVLQPDIGIAGGEDDRRAAAPPHCRADELEAAPGRAAKVAQAGVVGALDQPHQPVVAAGGTVREEGRVLGPGEEGLHHQEIVVVVLDDQDPQRLHDGARPGFRPGGRVVHAAMVVERDDGPPRNPGPRVGIRRAFPEARPRRSSIVHHTAEITCGYSDGST